MSVLEKKKSEVAQIEGLQAERVVVSGLGGAIILTGGSEMEGKMKELKKMKIEKVHIHTFRVGSRKEILWQ